MSEPAEAGADKAVFKQSLNRLYRWYTVGFMAFVLVLAVLEQWGLSRR